jgi:hypothetical protein
LMLLHCYNNQMCCSQLHKPDLKSMPVYKHEISMNFKSWCTERKEKKSCTYADIAVTMTQSSHSKACLSLQVNWILMVLHQSDHFLDDTGIEQ